MHPDKPPGILVENTSIESAFLHREVSVDFYLPKNVGDPSGMSLLFINDGQDMSELGLETILGNLYEDQLINPLLCVGIHAGANRKMEYGMISHQDFKGRGAQAGLYNSFIMKELLPYIRTTYAMPVFKEKAFAGFSLGGLSAMDIVWNNPDEFTKAGIFSGSLWWRGVDQHEANYDDDKHRLMHQQIRNGSYYPWLQFFFQCGNMDETKDRNNNGIIDSIDDTVDLINELEAKGYNKEKDLYYLELKDGRHNVATWGRAMPDFLKWGWGRGKYEV